MPPPILADAAMRAVDTTTTQPPNAGINANGHAHEGGAAAEAGHILDARYYSAETGRGPRLAIHGRPSNALGAGRSFRDGMMSCLAKMPRMPSARKLSRGIAAADAYFSEWCAWR